MFQVMLVEYVQTVIVFHDILVRYDKIPQTGWLKQQKSMFSQFWRHEGQDHCVSRVDFSKASLLGLRMAPSHYVLTRPIFCAHTFLIPVCQNFLL